MSVSNGTVLVVEDDPDAVFLLQRAFRKANLQNPIAVARDGQEAIDYLSRQGNYADQERHPLPVVMLLDLKMPRKTGFEVLDWLRRQPALKRLIVVVLTASNQVADINRAYDLGINSYLVKPAEFDTLVQMASSLGHYWLELNEPPDLQAGPALELREHTAAR